MHEAPIPSTKKKSHQLLVEDFNRNNLFSFLNVQKKR